MMPSRNTISYNINVLNICRLTYLMDRLIALGGCVLVICFLCKNEQSSEIDLASTERLFENLALLLVGGPR